MNRIKSGFGKLWQRPQASRVFLATLIGLAAFILGGLVFGGGGPGTSGNLNLSQSDDSSAIGATIWTCSMHPQIRLNKPGKCPICFMDLIPIESGGGDDLGPRQLKMSASARQLAKIETSPVIRAFAQREIRLAGKLDYDETRMAYITAWVSGRIDSLYVDYTGAYVSRGQKLVSIYSPELIAAQTELRQALETRNNLGKNAGESLLETAKATYKSAHEKLRLYGLSEDQIRQIEAAKEPFTYLPITAPVGGIVIQKNALEGMYVSTGTQIYTLADLSKLWVRFEAYESDLPWLRLGQEVSFASPSFPGENFRAQINFIDPGVNPNTRTVSVRAVVDNRNLRLKPEMFADGIVKARLDNLGKVIAPEKTETYSTEKDLASDAPLLIPASAPLITGKRAIVYVEIPDADEPLFEGREIELGPRAGDYYFVKSGLSEGEMVVTNGAFKIDSELQIHAKSSMMQPEEDVLPAVHQHDITMKDMVAGIPTPGYMAGDSSRLQIPETALAELTPVYDAYFQVQMALADDSLNGAKEYNTKILESLKAVDMKLFEGEAHHRWMTISAKLRQAADSGFASINIETARNAFYNLSLGIIALHDSFGHADDKSFYLTFCPMARDNQGAYWLQIVDTVYNSFYGAAMLRCGEIKHELKAEQH